MQPNQLTDKEVVELLKGNSTLNKARQIFSSYSAMIENDQHQRKPMGPIEMRRLEFEAVQKIKEIFDDN
jgi:hypothetical protein